MCDYLKLVFRPKVVKGPSPGLRDTTSTDREIQSAHAVARAERPKDEQVVLAIDAEHLHAFCRELFYEAPTPTCGPRTLLVGDPIVKANKENHIIAAKEIQLIGADLKGIGQLMTARGNVQVDLYDQSNEKNHYPVHAICKDLLTATKDKQGDQIYDLLILTEDASFIDDEHAQELHGQRLKLGWSRPTRPPPPTIPTTRNRRPPPPRGNGRGRSRPPRKCAPSRPM